MRESPTTVSAPLTPRAVRPDEIDVLLNGMRSDALVGAAIGALVPLAGSFWFGPIFGVLFGPLGGLFLGLTMVDFRMLARVKKLGLPEDTFELFRKVPVRLAFSRAKREQLREDILAGRFTLGR